MRRGPVRPQDSKLRDNASETAVLVHKLKTALKTLLNDRDHRRRFTGVVLVKAVVDVGGWETLRSSEPWVRGLIAVLQKKDPIGSKELAVVALTRIYSQLHGYQTLVREIATPTIPGFITACLQLLKSSAPGQPLRAPVAVVETIIGALATVIPLYPTTSRPFVSQIRTAIRPFLVPTLSDEFVVPASLQAASRRLAIALHYTAPKSGALKRNVEPPPGYVASKVVLGEAPRGGGDSADMLPAWVGVGPGSQRLIGLLGFMAEFILQPTKSPISIPVGVLVDAVSRVAQIARHSPKSQTAALELLLAICRRLGSSFVPVVLETLDYTLRIFKSGINTASVRQVSYNLLNEILPLSGPTMGKDTVSTLDLTNDNSATGPSLEPAHRLAAEKLLVGFLSHLPQRRLRPVLRSLLDQTAILTQNKDAMLASVLNPFRNKQSKMAPSILPFLSQLHPNDQALEIIRSNMRQDVDMENSPSGDEPLAAMVDELEVSPPAETPVFEAVAPVHDPPKENPFAPGLRSTISWRQRLSPPADDDDSDDESVKLVASFDSDPEMDEAE
ncbi:unnamed protein product [Parascedosporium putredinis]|uniref:Pre-rRNA-processing protein RIX1 n=1 Tax=Parascedosporium putredinis TaxID=1442378 RepID=A0A9P1H6S4_9PEZI|nr:unnamed protein product [Parascedosporium putredinis]CAI8000706.1 unnamed protein product [Parascedosporium putredinis]